MNRLAADGPRLQGLDVARFLALLGMVVVHFNLVMVTTGEHPGLASSLADILQGRSAATFVVLAGVGLGLSAVGRDWDHTLKTTLKRATFLLVVGLLNLMIFDADIIHYYAFFFFFGVFFLRATSFTLWLSIVALMAVSLLMVLFLDYDADWNWATYTYAGLWTPRGFVRNLFFNGWHPLLPWFAFILFGIFLSRLELRSRYVQQWLLLGGSFAYMSVAFLSQQLVESIAVIDVDAASLFTTHPIPPMPLYMVSGGSAACAVIGMCLLLESPLRSLWLLDVLTVPGRQTLTLYIAHIVIGMGVLEVLGLFGGQDDRSALVAAAAFTVAAIVFAHVWAYFFGRGLLEGLMHRLTEMPNRTESK